MTIGQYYTVSITCNLCAKLSPPVRHDRTIYQQQGQEDYTNRINTKALKLAAEEGFITIEKLIPNAAMPGGFQHNDLHICPACQGEMSFAKRKSTDVAIAKIKKAARNKKMM